MKPFRLPRFRLSLAAKIATITSIPILAVLVAALLAVNFRVAAQENRTVTADLARAALSFERQMLHQGEELKRIGIIVARDPKFFAMLTLPGVDRGTEYFQATLAGVVGDFQRDTEAQVFDVTDEHGVVLVRGGRPDEHGINISGSKLIREALASRPASGYMVEGRKAHRVAVVPILVGGTLVGTLTLGRSVDSELAQALKETTRSDVVFAVDGEIALSTLPESALRSTLQTKIREWREADSRLQAAGERLGQRLEVLPVQGERFLALRGDVRGPEVGGHLGYVLLRSLDQETLILKRIGVDLSVAGATAALLALLLGLGVAAGITRPIRRLVEAANEMRVGNYDFPLNVRSRDEMGRLAEDFEIMRDTQRHEIERLGEIDRMKSDFIAVASHEIITPVTMIRAYADMIGEGALGEVTPPQREGLSAIRRGTDTLTRLARDLTNMSLIERNQLPAHFAPCDIGEVLEEVAVQVAPFVTQRDQQLSISVEPSLVHPRIDRDYLSKAILNIAMNAVRFTPDGGSIGLAAQRVGDAVEVEVSDTGIGIAEEDQERIFSKLVELKDVNLHSSGTAEFNSSGLGLGLSIARGIVEAHGGMIQVESRVGEGSIFLVRLPFPSPEGYQEETTVSDIRRKVNTTHIIG
ncbi:MAG: HAMP domain-containing protein [Candidatus Eisenbacteria bacterium]|uniref:histidine kinase n=1 Tax=Eiseniibacteriota bacterium TaxID=2212470 RepID=A0A538SXA2_UNCEI|nr:MAG: HAMP domain-containing protein [Candidatus Eisenbacteria bacterium]TMQ62995.1 MAG: HAMP domain-containing protein [Candidatus Eisenbacteria bacterium]